MKSVRKYFEFGVTANIVFVIEMPYPALRMSGEHERKHELDPDLLVAFTVTFIPRNDMFPLQLENGRYVSRKSTLHPDLVLAHLKGLITLGAYALDTKSYAKWLCFDADADEVWQQLIHFSVRLGEVNVPSYLEASRRGGHLWLFIEGMPGADARRFGRQLISDYQLPSMELYPKQDVLRTGSGSFVRLPLGKHRLTNKRYYFITPGGQPLAPTIREQVAILSLPERVPNPFVESVLDTIKKRHIVQESNQNAPNRYS